MLGAKASRARAPRRPVRARLGNLVPPRLLRLPRRPQQVGRTVRHGEPRRGVRRLRRPSGQQCTLRRVACAGGRGNHLLVSAGCERGCHVEHDRASVRLMHEAGRVRLDRQGPGESGSDRPASRADAASRSGATGTPRSVEQSLTSCSARSRRPDARSRCRNAGLGSGSGGSAGSGRAESCQRGGDLDSRGSDLH